MFGTYRECFDHEGNSFSSEAEMALEHGVEPSTFSRRKLCGWPLEKCLEPYKNPFNNGDGFTYKGVSYNSLNDCCNKLGVSYKRTYDRITRKGMTPEEALDVLLNEVKQHKEEK